MGTSAFRLGASQANVVQLQEIITQAGHGFTAGDVVRPTTSGGVFALAKADSAANAEGIGVISEVNVNTFTVTLLIMSVPLLVAKLLYPLQTSSL